LPSTACASSSGRPALGALLLGALGLLGEQLHDAHGRLHLDEGHARLAQGVLDALGDVERGLDEEEHRHLDGADLVEEALGQGPGQAPQGRGHGRGELQRGLQGQQREVGALALDLHQGLAVGRGHARGVEHDGGEDLGRELDRRRAGVGHGHQLELAADHGGRELVDERLVPPDEKDAALGRHQFVSEPGW
jgi:hypothetical protein